MNALMIVDMQKGFINKNNDYIISGINKLLKEIHFDKYIVTKYKNCKNSPFANILGYEAMMDEESQSIAFDVNSLLGQFSVIEKNSYGISQYEIKNLKKQGINEVYLCGTDIDACVLSIAYNLFDNNIKPIFIMDICGTSARDLAMKDYTIKIIERNFGRKCMLFSDAL